MYCLLLKGMLYIHIKSVNFKLNIIDELWSSLCVWLLNIISSWFFSSDFITRNIISEFSKFELGIIKFCVIWKEEWNDKEQETNNWNGPSNSLPSDTVSSVGLTNIIFHNSDQHEPENGWVNELDQPRPVNAEDWLPPHDHFWVRSAHLRASVRNSSNTT